MTSTPEPMDPAIAALAATQFVASWIGRARPGDPYDVDPARRAAAWAHWMFTSMSPMTGMSDRPYVGLVLPGQFYDPKGTGPKVRPHLEIPAHLFERTDQQFPDRLAQMGNGLLFPWWLVPEVLAARRALFSVPRMSPADLIDTLNQRRVSLLIALTQLRESAANIWPAVEEHLISEPAKLGPLAAGPFSTEQIATFWAPAADLGLRVEFDDKLAEKAGTWVSRRVGVWRLVCENDAGTAVLGTITPRLTRSSLFTDPLFDPATEAPAAMLVRGLVLRRVLGAFDPAAGNTAVPALDPKPRAPGAGLRAVVARVGDKLPVASTAAAVRFLRAYPDPSDAWEALSAWASARGTAEEPRQAVLTVSRDGFSAAHRSALRAIQRAEDPDRDDINVVLPLAWDASNRIVRVTYAPRDTGRDAPGS